MRSIFIALSFAVLSTSYVEAQKWKQWEVEADTLLNSDDFEGALKRYSKVIKSSKLKSEDAYMALYKRAVCYYSLVQYQPALLDLEIFIEKFPELFQARILRAFIYRELDDNEKQLVDLNAALNLRPLIPDLMKWRATIYLGTEEYDKAINDLKYVQSIQDDAETEMYLGYAYYGNEQVDSAMYCMNKSIELDATYLPAYLYSGTFSLEQADYERAITYLNLALRLDPTNPSALFYKGVALIELDRRDEGCSCLNRAFYAGEDGAGDYLKENCYSTSK